MIGLIIFGIFVAISYSLFRDQLTPSLASIFQEATTMPTTFYLPDTPKGVEYTGNAKHYTQNTIGQEEFVPLSNYNLSKLGDNYPKNTIFELTFSMKTSKKGDVQLYTQNGSSRKYQVFLSQNNYTSFGTIHSNQADEFIEYKEKFILNLEDTGEHKGYSYLAFYSYYGTANKVTVKDISVRKVGTLK